eukprot:gene24694-33165_t
MSSRIYNLSTSGRYKDETTAVILSDNNTARKEKSVCEENGDQTFALGLNIIVLLDYINIPDADHQSTSAIKSTTTSVPISDFQIIAGPSKENTWLSSCLRVFKSRLLVEYFIKPITEPVWWKRLLLGCLILFVGAYGVFQAVRGFNWDFTRGFDKALYVVFAKASAALVTFFVTLGIVIVFPPVSSSLSEMPTQVLGFIKWRRLHADFFMLAMVCAASHTAFQVTRLVYYFSVPAYEYYFIITGGLLWFLFGAQACHHVLLPLVSAPKESPPTASEKWLKWFFRRSHIRVWIMIAMVVYPIHSAGHITTIALVALWYAVREKSTLDKHFTTVSFSATDSTLLVYVHTDTILVPNDFGYYCQLEVDGTGVSAPYTMIPRTVCKASASTSTSTSTTTSATATTTTTATATATPPTTSSTKAATTIMIFRIRIPSTFATSFMEKVDLGDSRSLGNTSEAAAPLPSHSTAVKFVTVRGPFHSFENSIRAANDRCLVVLTGSAGFSVAECILQFSFENASKWDKVVVLNQCTRKTPDAAMKQEYNKLLDSLLSSELVQNTYGGAVHSSAALVDRVLARAAPKHVMVQMYGSIDQALLRALIDEPNTHFLVCSEAIEGVIRRDRYFKGEQWSRIHIEKFKP